MASLPASAPQPDLPDTLPAWLHRQAQQRGHAVALRHKRLGVWREWRWRAVHDEVAGLAAYLDARGFGPGATLVLLSRPRPEPLLLALAAQWLGGEAVLLDPTAAVTARRSALDAVAADFVFAESLAEIELVRAAGRSPALLLHAEEHGLSAIPAWAAAADGSRVEPVHYAAALAAADAGRAIPPLRADAARSAFRIVRADGAGTVAQQALGHAELLRGGHALIAAEKLDEHEEAFAARAFATAAQARYLLAPWLIAGFRLNYPENLATRDNDRRELGPTLVAGTAETYRRVEALVYALLPPPGSRQRRLIDWALAPEPGLLRRVLGHWLVRRPLRDVVGFSRTRVPLLAGEPLPTRSRQFYAALGIHVRTWPDAAAAHEVPNAAAGKPGSADDANRTAPLAQGA